MRVLLSLLLFIAVLAPASAQIVDRSLSFGFRAHASALTPAGPGRWLVAGRGVPFPGALYADTLSVVAFDDAGVVLTRHYLDLPPMEVRWIDAVLALPDGGYIVDVQLNGCDFGGDRLLRCVGPDGQTLWDVEGHFNGMELLPDGAVLAYSSARLSKYKLTTGALEWDYELPENVFIYDLHFLSPGGDFLAVGSPDAQYWHNNGTLDNPDYALVNFSNLGPTFGLLTKLTPGFNGEFLSYEYVQGRFCSIDSTANVVVTSIDPPFVVNDFAYLPTGLAVVGRQEADNFLVRYDGNGQVLENYPVPEYWQQGWYLAARDSALAVAGNDVSGPGSFGSNFHQPTFETGIALWFRSYAGPAPTPPLPDAGVTFALRQSPVSVTAVPEFGMPGDSIYTLSGGNYRVWVRNWGSVPVQDVNLNVRFGRDEYSFICFSTPAQQKRYTGLDLAPGESVWLEFGDILALNQDTLPETICFFTSSPNETPDGAHENDYSCVSIFTGTSEAASADLRLFPNPASTAVFLVEPDGKPQAYRLFDARGRLVQTGEVSDRQSIDVAALPAGMYWLSVGQGFARVAVQH
jgi:hypothetical protein